MRIKSPRDFWAGLMFAGFGLFACVWAVTHYQMGSAVRMGPAYFPAVLGGLLALLGLAIFLGSFSFKGSAFPRFHLRPLLLILLATVAYGYLMKPAGLFLATLATVFIGAFAGHEFRWKEVAVLSVALMLFSWLVFVKGLTLPFPLCPDFIENCPIR